MKAILIRLAAYGTTLGLGITAGHNHTYVTEPGLDTDVLAYLWKVLLPALLAAMAAAMETWKNTGSVTLETQVASDLKSLGHILQSKCEQGDVQGIVKAAELVSLEHARLKATNP